jgi:hypothetical protein
MGESPWCNNMNMVHILIAATVHLGLLVDGLDLGVATTAILTLRVAISWKAQSSKKPNLFPHSLHRERDKSTRGVQSRREALIHSFRVFVDRMTAAPVFFRRS